MVYAMSMAESPQMVSRNTSRTNMRENLQSGSKQKNHDHFFDLNSSIVEIDACLAVKKRKRQQIFPKLLQKWHLVHNPYWVASHQKLRKSITAPWKSRHFVVLVDMLWQHTSCSIETAHRNDEMMKMSSLSSSGTSNNSYSEMNYLSMMTRLLTASHHCFFRWHRS